MDWQQLLSSKRLRDDRSHTDQHRTPFQQDLDRIVFSAAFRRLANKTQVHPLPGNDHVHTRLTHSVEVASVGRTLGTIVGAHICKDSRVPTSPDTIGDIVQAACLAHDIGNPPFGHSGEQTIQDWFKSEKGAETLRVASDSRLLLDFQTFDGNAQGFRTLTQLENYRGNGGLCLTMATLATFTKYPRGSVPLPDTDGYVGSKKTGFFDAERHYFEEIASAVGLRRRAGDRNHWVRHPLVYLVEAADDICYAIVDIEDGFELGYLSYDQAADVLTQIAGSILDLKDMKTERDKIGKIRAVAIGAVIRQVADAFIDHEKDLLNGTLKDSLIDRIPLGVYIKEAKILSFDKLINSPQKSKIELAGREVVSGLLDYFSRLIEKLESVKWNPDNLRGDERKLSNIMTYSIENMKSRYEAMLVITDFISGMTDRYAINLYRRLKGISIVDL